MRGAGGLRAPARERPRTHEPARRRPAAGAPVSSRYPVGTAELLALHATAGNAAVQRLLDLAAQRQEDGEPEQLVPVAPLTGQGEPAEVQVEGGCDGLSLHGRTNATFNGGRWSVAGQRVTTSTSCGECPPGARCLHLTGTLVTTYSTAVTISMPGVPSGLTACEAARVRAFLTNVLRPHEQDHERRFRTYDGTTRNPLDLTGCGQADLNSQISAIQAAEDSQRQASANALSAAIDPFVRVVDCSDCDG